MIACKYGNIENNVVYYLAELGMRHAERTTKMNSMNYPIGFGTVLPDDVVDLRDVLERITRKTPKPLRNRGVVVHEFQRMAPETTYGNESYKLTISGADCFKPAKRKRLFLHVRRTSRPLSKVKKQTYDPYSRRIPDLIVRVGDRIDDIVQRAIQIIILAVNRVRRTIDGKRHKNNLRQHRFRTAHA